MDGYKRFDDSLLFDTSLRSSGVGPVQHGSETTRAKMGKITYRAMEEARDKGLLNRSYIVRIRICLWNDLNTLAEPGQLISNVTGSGKCLELNIVFIAPSAKR
jgi:hypothetical protein